MGDRLRALILGGAACVWEDVDALEQMLGRQWDGLVVAANDIGAHWPRRLDYWVSLHPNKFRTWTNLRWTLGHPGLAFLIGKPPVWHTDFQCDATAVPWLGGSSGMFAVQAALECLEVERAVLCGIPLTPTGHFRESREDFGAVWGSADNHWRAWLKYKDKMTGRVRSMSGRTAELLGTPTVDWLQG